MTTDRPSFFDGASAGYTKQLQRALDDHLSIVRHHAAGQAPSAPWDFEAALVAIRWIADELRRISYEEPPVPF